MMTDPIADLLTRIRNGISARRREVSMPASRLKRDVADALKREGFIESWELTPDGAQGKLTIRQRQAAQSGEDLQQGRQSQHRIEL